MKETIGNVLLNLDYYDGEDAYSDGSIEDRLLEIVKTTPKEDYQKVILTVAVLIKCFCRDFQIRPPDFPEIVQGL